MLTDLKNKYTLAVYFGISSQSEPKEKLAVKADIYKYLYKIYLQK